MSRPILFSFLLLGFALAVRSEPPTKGKPQASPAEIERFIKQLASDRFAEREAASKALDAIGEPALQALKKVATESADAEVRQRAKSVVESVESRLYRELRCFKGHTDSVYRVAFSPDGTQALSGSNDGTMRLWEVQTGKELHRFVGHKAPVMGVAFNPDGRQALSSSSDKTIRLWALPATSAPKSHREPADPDRAIERR